MKKKTAESGKNNTLKKQLKFKSELGLTESGEWGANKYPQIFSNKDAQNGANFYCYRDQEEWEKLQDWAKRPNGKKVNFTGAGMKNMLRSEHIPYNLFYPLEKLRQENPQLLKQFLEELFRKQNLKVDKVTKIKIEFASDLPKKELLDDNTSFDAYIEYMDGTDKCGLGIEVKYTERSYPFGKTEKTRMDNMDSTYNTLTRNSKIYVEDAHSSLNSKKLKQPWRNHLLGLKLLELKELDKFYSVHIYPEGNTYQKDNVCDEYIKYLTDDAKDTFAPITFEKFIEVSEKIFYTPEHLQWVDYLKSRY